MGSGAGSGSGSEDDEDDDEGSGLGPFEPSNKPDAEHPSVHVDADNDDDEDTHPAVTTHTTRPNVDDKNPLVHTTHVTHDHNDLGEPRHEDDDDDNDGDVDEDEDNVHNSSTDGATRTSSAPEKMTLRRALFVYLLPLYMTWFGGVCADLL